MTDEWKVPEGFEMVPIYPDGETAVPLEGLARLKISDGHVDFDVTRHVPALPLKHHGKMWHTGWDIPTEWAIDSKDHCWLNDAHGGALVLVEKSTLVATADTEEEKNSFRRLLGMVVPPPEWHKKAIAEGWLPPAEMLGNEPPTKSMQQLAKEALAVQDACNIMGVTIAYHNAMVNLMRHLNSTDAIRLHPIAQVWADKIASLTDTQTLGDERVLKAFNEVHKLM